MKLTQIVVSLSVALSIGKNQQALIFKGLWMKGSSPTRTDGKNIK